MDGELLQANGRSRRWVFTLNNYTVEEEGKVQEPNDRVKYIIYGREVGESGTKHLQGFVQFKQPASFNQVKEYIPRAHWEKARGTTDQAITYCQKDGDIWEFGDKPAQGKRNDLSELRELVFAGKRTVELASEHFGTYVRYHRGIEKVVQLVRREREKTPPLVYYIWGPTGSGKTRSVYEKHQDVWTYPGKGWFCGYEGQECALLDDLRADDGLSFGFLLRLLDRYPVDVPTKGGHTYWDPKYIYITSNVKPEELYRMHDSAPLLRRITEIKYLE